MVKITRRIAFVVLAAAQVLFPLALVGWNEIDLHRGKEIRLLVQPVDPNDFFRGEYVALSYRISSLRTPAADLGDTVYVPLRREGDVWTGTYATTQKPRSGTFIRGRVTGDEFFQPIQFGIETFFVPEGQSRKYEDAMSSRRLLAIVSVNGDGKARVKRLEIR
jgi:uncharacterized membrane-anchored protein